MQTAAQRVVSALLEDDGEEFDPRSYLQQIWAKSADVTPETAMTADRFYHRTLKYKGTKEPIQVRRNGRTKTWKRDPDKFRIPVKFGLRNCFYIDNSNAHDWAVEKPQ